MGLIGRRLALLFGFCLLAGCARTAPDPPPDRTERIRQALDSAQQFLLGRQSADGAWRSDVYGNFKTGDALTPVVLEALAAIDPKCEAFGKGSDYLSAFVPADARIDADAINLNYPVYTAAGAVKVLSLPENARQRKARDAWRDYLRELQLVDELGWQPADMEYGGWGYAVVRPRKPRPDELRPSLLESNLSATVSALAALRASGVAPDDPAFARALIFIHRCQNFPHAGEGADPAFDDGGFFFIYDDPVRNKAGPAGTDRFRRERFSSYGSTTADGLRALFACGQSPTASRAAAARAWLERHFLPDAQPGRFSPDSEPRRDAVYFYYAASVAQALRAADPTNVAWQAPMADALLARQRPDGSWVNDVRASREDDPLVATALAVLALGQCRAVNSSN